MICIKRNINLIHSSVKNPTTNGVCEVVHQDIVNSLLAQKLELKIKYDISFSLANAIKAHNNTIHGVTKFSPNYLFHNYQEISKELIHDRMASSQNYAKKN